MVNTLPKKSNIIVYSTEFCPYCMRVRSLLEEKGVAYSDIRVDKQPESRQEMMQRSGRSSVPQIFIDDFHVGGCNDLFELDHLGQLDHKLGLTAENV